MNNLLTRDEMEQLRKTDFELYKQEISKGWATQDTDIAKVKSIMASFDAEDASKHIIVGGKNFPIWAIDAYQYFDAKYGSQYGSVIFEKVLSKIWGEVPQDVLMV